MLTRPDLSYVTPLYRPVPNEPGLDDAVDMDVEEVLGPSGWEPVDLLSALDGDGPPPPAVWSRDDGVPILYPGKVQAYLGEPETMKSWAWQVAAVQVLSAGDQVLVIDFENDATSVVDRLRALGATREQILAGLVYINPDETWSGQAADQLQALVAEHPFVLAVVDGVTDGYDLLGLKMLENSDAAKFDRRLLRPLARAGAAVVSIDHVAKDSESRGRYAIGAQHKLASITGAALVFDVKQPFGRGEEGVSTVTVVKDKPGWLRQHAEGKVLGELRLKSWPDGGITSSFAAPQGASDTSGGFVPTQMMERASRFAEVHPGMSKNDLATGVGGKRHVALLAISLLVENGYLEVAGGPRNAQFHSSARPYRKGDPLEKESGDDPRF